MNESLNERMNESECDTERASYQVKEYEMIEACSTHGRNEKCIHLSENMKGRENSENLDVGGRILPEWILWIGLESVDWMRLAQDRHQWQVLVNTVMNLTCFIKGGGFFD
jgi:hypothetical protein